MTKWIGPSGPTSVRSRLPCWYFIEERKYLLYKRFLLFGRTWPEFPLSITSKATTLTNRRCPGSWSTRPPVKVKKSDMSQTNVSKVMIPKWARFLWHSLHRPTFHVFPPSDVTSTRMISRPPPLQAYPEQRTVPSSDGSTRELAFGEVMAEVTGSSCQSDKNSNPRLNSDITTPAYLYRRLFCVISCFVSRRRVEMFVIFLLPMRIAFFVASDDTMSPLYISSSYHPWHDNSDRISVVSGNEKVLICRSSSLGWVNASSWWFTS